MSRALVFILLCIPYLGFTQQFNEIVPLTSDLAESSGLIYLNGKIITHNDSQGDAALYEIDSITGNYSRKVVIINASNLDWEDITADSTHIFIGDFGNNAGTRTNLKIYRISIADYFNTANDSIFCDTIRFNYSDQTIFTSAPQATNFDCEAIAAMGDSLYLFTKNWLNAKTYVYTLSKNPGTYSAIKIDSISVQGLITGADYHIPSDRLTLCGYTQFPFVVEMNNPRSLPFSQNTFVRYNLPNTPLIQLEAIVTYTDNNYYLTAEAFQGIAVRLYRLKGTTDLLELPVLDETKFTVSPNPANNSFTITSDSMPPNSFYKIYDQQGKKMTFKSTVNIDKSISFETDFPPGVYFVNMYSDRGNFQKKMVIQ